MEGFNIHFCTEEPCQLELQECLNVLESGFELNYVKD